MRNGTSIYLWAKGCDVSTFTLADKTGDSRSCQPVTRNLYPSFLKGLVPPDIECDGGKKFLLIMEREESADVGELSDEDQVWLFE